MWPLQGTNNTSPEAVGNCSQAGYAACCIAASRRSGYFRTKVVKFMRKEKHKQETQTIPPNNTTQKPMYRYRLGNVYFDDDTPPKDVAHERLPVEITHTTYETVFQGYPDVLDVKHVSEMLNISCKTVYRLLNEGKLASLKVGRAFKVPKLYLLQYLMTTDVK